MRLYDRNEAPIPGNTVIYLQELKAPDRGFLMHLRRKLPACCRINITACRISAAKAETLYYRRLWVNLQIPYDVSVPTERTHPETLELINEGSENLECAGGGPYLYSRTNNESDP